MSDNTRGVCMFAYNNEQIDYIKLAILAASHVKLNLGLPVCLITDEGTWEWANESQKTSLLKTCFDKVVITNDERVENIRGHFDSPWTEFRAQFTNNNKHKIYEYSPYEQTLLIDTDYIIKNDFLLHVFDTDFPVAMFDRAISLRNDKPHPRETWLYDAGVTMWWSTVVYFDRSEKSKLFFDTWAHVADNYDYYQFLYNFPGKLFRTDYCVSAATHILNGMMPGNTVYNFADHPMIYMSQKDDLLEIKNNNDWIFLANDTRENWKDILVKHGNLDIHMMNKRALDRHYDVILESIYE